MTTTIPYEPLTDAVLRVRTSQRFNGFLRTEPMASATTAGLEVVRLTRAALPGEDEAVFWYRFGRINGTIYGAPQSVVRQASQGEPQEYPGDELDLPMLLGREVIVEAQLADESWTTIWWGQCLAQLNSECPGASMPDGVVEYHCVGPFYRYRNRFFSEHQQYFEGSNFKGPGNPGYNVWDEHGHVVGNMESTLADPYSLGYISHTYPDLNAASWTDRLALEHALMSTRPMATEYEPEWSISDDSDLLDRVHVWAVDDTLSVREFLEKILDPRSGLVACAEWDQGEGWPANPTIAVTSVFHEAVTVTLPSDGSEMVLAGATTNAVNVDLIGDHRLGEDAISTFKVWKEQASQYDALETLGDRIQILVTLSKRDGTLELDQTVGEKANLDTEDWWVADAYPTVYGHIDRCVKIPSSWDGETGTGTGWTDAACWATRQEDPGSTAMKIVKADSPYAPWSLDFTDTLPLFEGYEYGGTSPVKLSFGTTRARAPIKPIIWRRVNDSSDYWNVASLYTPMELVHLGGGSFKIVSSEGSGVRPFDGDPDDIAITVNAVLPARMGYYSARGHGKIKRLVYRQYQLHLAHRYAMWSLGGYSENLGGYLPQRECCLGPAAEVGIIRDDRDALAVVHAIAREWYLRERQCLQWRLICCGFLPTYRILTDAGDEEEREYPRLGQLLHEASFGGRTITADSPITEIVYDHQSGTTTWKTSWGEMDWRGMRV